MDSSIPFFGVLLAAASAFAVGGLWYSPTLFLKPWQKMVGSTDSDMKKRFPTAMGLMAIGALLSAYILAHFILYSERVTGAVGVSAGLQTGFWAWVGLALPSVIAGGALEPRDPMVMVIYAGNRLVTLLLMGLILGAFM
jgi:hypothetical protein